MTNRLSEIIRLHQNCLTTSSGSVTIGIDEFIFLIREAKILSEIRTDAEDFYNEEIDFMDLGERVINTL